MKINFCYKSLKHQKDITQRIVTVTLKRYYHVPIHCTMICKNSKFSKQFPNVR